MLKSVIEFDLLMEEGNRSREAEFYDEAVDAFKKATKINPNSVEACQLLGDCQAAKGQDKEAAFAYRKVAEKAGTATANDSREKNKRSLKHEQKTA